MQKFTETIPKGSFIPKKIHIYKIKLTLKGENLGQSDISVQRQCISGYEHEEIM